MSAFKGFIYKHKNKIVFAILIIISITLMATTNKKPVVTVRKVGFTIVSPFQFIFESFGNFFQGTFNSISELKKIRQELNQTKQELDQYKKIIIDFNNLNNENNELRKLLSLKNKISYDTEACEIIGRDPKTLFDILIINKGIKHGIRENMPVITYAAGKKTLIGKVVETTLFASKVMTLHNPKLSIGSIIANNRVHTIVQGDNKRPGFVKLLYVPREYTYSDTTTDHVYTSGDSLIFPRGIEIGKIKKIYPSERYENFNNADLELSANLSKVEFVIVLKVDYKKDNFKIMDGFNQ